MRTRGSEYGGLCVTRVNNIGSGTPLKARSGCCDAVTAGFLLRQQPRGQHLGVYFRAKVLGNVSRWFINPKLINATFVLLMK